MTSDSGLEDFSLMELFRIEVETHSEVLSSALLALERAPGDTSHVDEMMRTAHSIKGAARVVGVDPAVRVAHVMEDCFIAAQRGALVLLPSDVDTLLRSVDLLGKISEATRDPGVELAIAFVESVESLVVKLEAMLVPKTRPGEVESEDGSKPREVEASEAEPAASSRRADSNTPDAATVEFPEILDAAAGEEIRRDFCRRSKAVADRFGWTFGRQETWMCKGWHFWRRFPFTPPGTAARVSGSWEPPPRWTSCSACPG